MTTYFSYYHCPIGKLRLRCTDTGLTGVDHVNQQNTLNKDWVEQANHPILQQAISELTEYFSGKRTTFSTPLAATGTEFQQQVWQELTRIPYGEVVSYSTIAERIGNPKSVRAVGAANGRNPLSIFVPCHRVTGKNGTLTGYAGGLENKQILLEHEGCLTPELRM